MTQPDTARDITVIPRAVISAAVGVVHKVERAVGSGPIRTARDNAWEAVCADRALARQRDELRRRAAAFNHSAPLAQAALAPAALAPAALAPAARNQAGLDHSAVGSSPRSRAAQA